ncbi:hypothetical protein DRQ09_09090 [candidate division KSB1 bacterium]|nr:MAG: hypothetical protein DRQ09_09090 [candidate division KSB1 bacterium]
MGIKFEGKMMRKLKIEEGFSLVEVVIVIVILGIISVVAIPRVSNFISQSKINATMNEMKILKKAIIGDPSYTVNGVPIDRGFKGDVGQSPAKLEDLVTNDGSYPAWNRWTKTGWNGPYINDNGSGDYLRDAWGTEYQLTSNSIRSAGPNKVFGDDDDIVVNY